MRKLRLSALISPVLFLTVLPLSAQGVRDRLESNLKPYGFFRTIALYDSRESVTSSGGLFYYLPYDKYLNLDGKDIYYNPSLKLSSATARLGMDVTGYRSGSLKVTGRIEADFSLLNGGSATFSLRHAWAKLLWDDLGYSDYSLSLLLGQTWNPMTVGLPYCVSIENGAPFNPYARSPQLMLELEPVKGLSITAGAIYPVQYLPTGPAGPSEDYIRYGIVPELYAGLSFSAGGFSARLGADFLSLRPRWRAEAVYMHADKGSPVKDRISMLSPMVYLQYESGAFKINAKSVLASGGDHLRMMGGYALCDVSDVLKHRYTPLRSSASFVSLSAGTKWQFLCMLGYMKSLGTAEPLLTDAAGHPSLSDVYYFKDGFVNVGQMARATPTLAFNSGKITVALEYDCTAVQYGDINSLDANLLCTSDLHWILNHRLQTIFKFNF